VNPRIETAKVSTLALERKLQVGKRRVGKYPRVFREKAVERMRNCDSILELAKEPGVLRENIAAFIDGYYNRVRLHSALGYKPAGGVRAGRLP
jgi:transposase InsO family protein